MLTKTESYTVAKDRTTGADVVGKTGSKLAVTASGKNIWFHKGAELNKYITYKHHEKGDIFTAMKDSTRTKGEVMGKDCPQGQEQEPLYLKGEVVTRNAGFDEFVGFTDTKEQAEVSFAEKMELAAKYGVKISM